MDALADVLKTIRLSANTYFCTDFKTPWGMTIEHSKEGQFHVVVDGSCWLKVDNAQQPILLNSGDIVAFPTGGGHWISHTQDSPKLPGHQVVQQIQSGQNPFEKSEQMNEPQSLDNDIKTTLMCGSFNYDSAIDHPFIRDLPCFIHINSEETPQLQWLRTLVHALSKEAQTPMPGSSVIIDRLTEVLVIQLMRTYTEQSSLGNGSENSQKSTSNNDYLSALMDSIIGPALNLIHADDHAYWTVERLAEEVSLSRTAFTERFTRQLNMPPKTYLVNWRMQKAKEHLRSGQLTTIEIAEQSGYSSEAAFGKAFKGHFGVPPGQIRRQGSR